MLAPEDDTQTMDAARFSLASEIVEMVVLTADEGFLQTLREAVGPSRRLWHVLSADKVGDLLLAGGVGILVLDVHALRQACALFVAQMRQQFPDLVIVVAGARDAETELARLISDGTVYRFIHKPMSPARARLFADAAVKRYEGQRRRVGEQTAAAAKPRGNAGLAIAGGCAAICAIAGGFWALAHGDRRHAPAAGAPAANTAAPDESADPRTAGTATDSALLARAAQALAANRLIAPGGDNALELYLQELARNPANSEARSGIATLRERLLARAQSALLDQRLDEAAGAIETARRAGADLGRIVLLTAELAKARAQLKASTDAPRPKAQAGPDGASPAAAQAGPDGVSPAAAPAERSAALGRASEAPAAAERQLRAADQAPATTQQPPREAPTVADVDHGSPAAPQPSAPNGVIDAGQLVLVKSVQPDYPLKAREDSLEGWVEVEFTVAETGRVKDPAVHAANPRGVFEQAAIHALLQWRYKPVVVDAKPVSQRARIRIRFALAR